MIQPKDLYRKLAALLAKIDEGRTKNDFLSPLLVHGEQVKQLKATGTILGARPEISLQRAFTSFAPGAVLVMYSDGVLERRNEDDEEFGLARLEKLIVQHQQKSAPKILEVIYQTIFAFDNQARWQDDVTVVVIKKCTAGVWGANVMLQAKCNAIGCLILGALRIRRLSSTPVN